MAEPKRTILEAAILAVAGIALALTANAMNPQGLKLGRDYFMMGARPAATRPTSAPAGVDATTRPAVQEGTTGAGAAAAQGSTDPAEDPYAGLAAEMRAKLEHFGLQPPIGHAELVELFSSPEYGTNLYVVIDAREPREYAGGHIPGAHHIYYYDEHLYVPDVLPFAQAAEKVIVYCNGGDCDDSVLTAVLLRDQYFLDPTRIVIYAEGYEGWKSAGLPVERGVRDSGDIVEGVR